jgi:PBP1b-binding outer membrane lipoprotein LpoB
MAPNKMLLTLVSALLVAACSSQQTLQTVEPQATRVALKQGQTDLACPAATSQVVSSSLAEPPPGGDFKGQQLQYNIAVAGCGKSNTYSVKCPQDGSACYIPAPGAK